jgi:hypothetical protein
LAVVGGGYLRNTIRELGVTCTVCTTPVDPQYTHSYRCYQHLLTASDRKQHLARLVLPLVYGVAGSQSGYLMRQYKGSGATLQQRSRLTLLLALALTIHRRCIESQVGYEVSAWTAIPSTQGRPGDHPIRAIASQAQPAAIELILAQGDPPTVDRSYLPERWRVFPSPVVADRHVLVIDDTWTTGGRAQSAASALVAAGAAAVSIVVLARWLDPSYGNTASFISARLVSDYDPEMPRHGRSMPLRVRVQTDDSRADKHPRCRG